MAPVSPRLDTTCPVLIFKASRGVIHHGAVGVARTLGRLGVPVYAVVEDALTPLARSRYLTQAFFWEGWPNSREAFLKSMSSVGEAIGRPAILIPMDDLSAISVAENAAELREWFLFPELPSDLPRQLANKTSLLSLCKRVGIPCAQTALLRSADDARKFMERNTFPIIAKAAEQWQLLKNRYSVVILPNREALFELYENTESEDRSQVILQEYIPGEDWIYHGYSNFKTDLFVSFTGKKILSYPLAAGSTALGLSCSNDVLRRQSETFLRTISYSGIVDIDYRLDERNGQYKIVDCNPRVGQNFRMFENQAAIDVVRAMHLNLSGRGIECRQMVKGRLFAVETFLLPLSLRRRMWNAEISAASAGRRELAWWCNDDPVPFFLMSIRLLLRVLNRRIQQILDWAMRKTS
jgi:D-aspartate ligase